MDVDDINTFTDVLVNTFETTCSNKPFRSAPFNKLSGGKLSYNGLLCTLSFTGGLVGSLILAMPAQVACKIYGSMMMEDVDELDDEVAEGFTEIANMIVGNIKADLSEYKLVFESPSIEIGEGAAPDELCQKTWLYIPLAFKEWGEFSLFLNVETA